HHGFITDERRRMKVKQFKCPGPDGRDSEVYVRRQGASGQDTVNFHFWQGPRRSHLSSRGWALQEGILAPRILHFTAEELAWECMTQTQCECTLRPNKFMSSPLKRGISKLTFHGRWESLVEDFTDRDLTFG